jgi:hypothetical protein
MHLDDGYVIAECVGWIEIFVLGLLCVCVHMLVL